MAKLPIALLLTGVAAIGGSARAQSGAAPGEAKRHFERGLRLYDGHSYEEAIVELRASYQIDPRPEILYALGQAQRMNHQCREAIVSYEAYLRTGPGVRQEAATRDQIELCRAELAGETGASDRTAPTPPVPTPAPVAAPQAAGAPIATAMPAAPAGPVPASVDAIRAAPVPATEQQSAPLYRRWWFWALVGGGVAAGLAMAASAGAFTRTMEPACPAGRYCIP
jgi:hypothetical protein